MNDEGFWGFGVLSRRFPTDRVKQFFLSFCLGEMLRIKCLNKSKLFCFKSTEIDRCR